jgi:hypothetical protein
LQRLGFRATVLPMSSKVSARTAHSSSQVGGSRRRGLPELWLAAAVAAILLSPSSGFAKQEYYDALNDTGTCQNCTLCHNASPGLPDNLSGNKPFLLGMLGNMREGQLPTETMDSDMDGFTDLEELREFGDPNDPLVGPDEGECPNQPEYGCLTIAHRAERRSLESAWAGLAVLGAMLLRRRSR